MTEGSPEHGSQVLHGPVVAVVVAAGVGRRLGLGEPKALTEVGGRALVAHAVERLRSGGVERVVVVHTPGHADRFAAACEDVDVDAWVEGGAERSDSVRVGCRVAIDRFRAAVVAVHDAARALVPPAVVRATLDALGGDVVASAPGLPVPDTLKRASEAGDVTGTVDRRGVWAVHTPQAFLADTLSEVLHWSAAVDPGDVTDDLALFEAARTAGAVHGTARLVRSHALAGKVTWPEDLAHAEQLLASGLADPHSSEQT